MELIVVYAFEGKESGDQKAYYEYDVARVFAYSAYMFLTLILQFFIGTRSIWSTGIQKANINSSEL